MQASEALPEALQGHAVAGDGRMVQLKSACLHYLARLWYPPVCRLLGENVLGDQAVGTYGRVVLVAFIEQSVNGFS